MKLPRQLWKAKILRMVFAIYFILEMEMLSCGDWNARISESLVLFCLFENIVFISQNAFFCVCAKQVSASAQTNPNLSRQLLIPNSVGFK